MIDPAKEIFNQVVDHASILSLINQQVENLYVDYKSKRDADSDLVDEELQKAISKGISGFANSDGGVLIIGVDSRPGHPNKIVPIGPLGKFEQSVNSCVARATSFVVQGIRVKSIPTDDQTGIVVIYIPKSELAPHCSMKDKKYYQRIGDSFMPMEHYQIADAFGKRYHPNLIPYAIVKRDVNTASMLTAVVGIGNSGRAVARFPFLKIIDLSDFQVSRLGIDGHGRFGLRNHLNPTNSKNYKGGSDDVVHPGAPLDIVLLERSFSLDNKGQLSGDFQELILAGEVVADQFMLRKWQIVLTRHLIQTHLSSNPLMQSEVIHGELL